MKNDDLIIKYSHHFSVTECNHLSRDSTPYPMNARAKIGVGFDYVSADGYRVFSFRPTSKSMRTKILSHRMIFYIINGYLPECVDHANHDKLDNSVGNLRSVTHSQNCMNRLSRKNSSSKYLGVNWIMMTNKWKSLIRVDGLQLHLGCFTSETEAAQAYNLAAAKHFGEFANLNTIQNHK